MSAGLYIHIPFCKNKCHYCDFYSVKGKDALIARYLSCLRKEIEIYSHNYGFSELTFETIYFGGGTPSLLLPSQIDSLLQYIYRGFKIDPQAEITLEVNPETVDYGKLKAFRRMGVDRLSIGLQSFNDQELKILGRIHNAQQAINCVPAARKAGFENLGIDLIFAIPGQSLKSWQLNLKTAVNLSPEHLSSYSLTIEKETPLARDIVSGQFQRCPEDLESQMYLEAIDFLESQSYEHYEISNFARSGFRSRHNQSYWTGKPYLGLGASAHSFLNNERFWNFRDVKKYINFLSAGKLPVAEREILTPNQLLLEHVFLSLRRSDGLNLAEFERKFGENFMTRYEGVLNRLTGPDFQNQSDVNSENSLLCLQEGSLKLTRKGLLVYDELCSWFT